MKIRAATSADLPFMMELARASATAAHWTEQQYGDLFAAVPSGVERVVLVAEREPEDAPHSPPGTGTRTLLGFLVARHVAAEWELENIVAAPAFRRKRLGTRLLEALLDKASQDNESVFLEVRESNVAARSLYEHVGFQEMGRRKSYYLDPPEDAILYRRKLR